MAAVAVKSNEGTLDRYKGETKNQMRHGRGVYVYPNEFFKYDGQWKNGEKHGHGKLLMGDGGYYEGTFENGEIDGQGYRVFGLSGSTYTGQFHNGEFNGYGLLVNNDGSQYEGGWCNNKREGQGILRLSDGTVFEGEFHNHKQHGTGSLIDSNGDNYEGDWIDGLKHGHGIQTCIDGTIYEGQWRGGVYHGEGSLVHASGFKYKGMWYNGRPAEEPVSLSLATDTPTPLTVDQGQTFSLTINCVNDEGDVINDNGRSFKVSCYIDKNTIKRRTNNVSYSVITNNDLITIPSHGEVYSYELLQTRQKHDMTASEESIPLVTSEQRLPDNNLQRDNILHCESMIQSNIDHTPTVTIATDMSLVVTSASLDGGPLQPVVSGKLETKSMYSMNDKPKSATSQERFLSTLVTPKFAMSNKGKIEFKELYIPPPPAPQLESVITKSMGGINIPSIARTSSMNLSGCISPLSSSPKVPRSPSVTPMIQSDNELKKKSSNNVSKTMTKKPPPLATVAMNKTTDKEKLLHVKREKYCATGAYIIQVSEVTFPPFLDKLLPPVYIELKVISHTVKDASLDKILMRNRSKNKQK